MHSSQRRLSTERDGVGDQARVGGGYGRARRAQALGFGALLLLVGGCLTGWVMQTSWAQSSPSERVGKVVLVLGDSLAAGYGLDPSEAFPALLQDKLDALGWPDKVVNAGVSGDTTAGGLRRLDWLLRQKVDVLLLELGGNDGLRGIQPEATRANLQAIIDRARQKYPRVQVIVTGMRMPPNLGAEYVDKFAKIFPGLARENKTQLVPFLLEGVGGRSELNQADRIHPTAAGQKILAENVWRVLKPLLEAKPGGSTN
jgi:acyl-CoA thioesterase I